MIPASKMLNKYVDHDTAEIWKINSFCLLWRPCCIFYGLSGFPVVVPHSGWTEFTVSKFFMQSPTAHFHPLFPALGTPILLCSWFENIDFPEQLYPLISALYQLALCRQFYLILILHVITHQATVFSNLRILHTTCYYLLGQHKTYFTDAHKSWCSCKPIWSTASSFNDT